MEKKHWLTIILIAYIALMLVGVILPNPNAVPGFANNTKIFHIIGFAILSILVLKNLQSYKYKNIYTLAIIFIIFFTYLTETLQLFIPNRHFLWTDMLIDFMGALIGVGLYKWIFYKQ